jgi:hypothetical protein
MNKLDLLSFLSKLQNMFPNLEWSIVCDEVYTYVDWEEEFEDDSEWCMNTMMISIEPLALTKPKEFVVTVKYLSSDIEGATTLKTWRNKEDCVLKSLYNWLQGMSKVLNKIV